MLAALGDPADLALLAQRDPHDNGIADIWRIQLRRGRRIGEVVKLRFDCVLHHELTAQLCLAAGLFPTAPEEGGNDRRWPAR